jgi:hypothetical protein
MHICIIIYQEYFHIYIEICLYMYKYIFIYIHLYRHWRDYDSETIYIKDLQRGQQRIEENYNQEMNAYLNSNLQPNRYMNTDYFSVQSEEFVRSPSVYASLQVHTYIYN